MASDILAGPSLPTEPSAHLHRGASGIDLMNSAPRRPSDTLTLSRALKDVDPVRALRLVRTQDAATRPLATASDLISSLTVMDDNETPRHVKRKKVKAVGNVLEWPAMKETQEHLDLIRRLVDQELEVCQCLTDRSVMDPQRFKIYRQAFERIVNKFVGFGALLAEIKREYDSAIEILEKQVEDAAKIGRKLQSCLAEAENIENVRAYRDFLQDKVDAEEETNKSLKSSLDHLRFTKGRAARQRRVVAILPNIGPRRRSSTMFHIDARQKLSSHAPPLSAGVDGMERQSSLQGRRPSRRTSAALHDAASMLSLSTNVHALVIELSKYKTTLEQLKRDEAKKFVPAHMRDTLTATLKERANTLEETLAANKKAKETRDILRRAFEAIRSLSDAPRASGHLGHLLGSHLVKPIRCAVSDVSLFASSAGSSINDVAAVGDDANNELVGSEPNSRSSRESLLDVDTPERAGIRTPSPTALNAYALDSSYLWASTTSSRFTNDDIMALLSDNPTSLPSLPITSGANIRSTVRLADTAAAVDCNASVNAPSIAAPPAPDIVVVAPDAHTHSSVGLPAPTAQTLPAHVTIHGTSAPGVGAPSNVSSTNTDGHKEKQSQSHTSETAHPVVSLHHSGSAESADKASGLPVALTKKGSAPQIDVTAAPRPPRKKSLSSSALPIPDSVRAAAMSQSTLGLSMNSATMLARPSSARGVKDDDTRRSFIGKGFGVGKGKDYRSAKASHDASPKTTSSKHPQAPSIGKKAGGAKKGKDAGKKKRKGKKTKGSGAVTPILDGKSPATDAKVEGTKSRKKKTKRTRTKPSDPKPKSLASSMDSKRRGADDAGAGTGTGAGTGDGTHPSGPPGKRRGRGRAVKASKVPDDDGKGAEGSDSSSDRSGSDDSSDDDDDDSDDDDDEEGSSDGSGAETADNASVYTASEINSDRTDATSVAGSQFGGSQYGGSEYGGSQYGASDNDDDDDASSEQDKKS